MPYNKYIVFAYNTEEEVPDGGLDDIALTEENFPTVLEQIDPGERTIGDEQFDRVYIVDKDTWEIVWDSDLDVSIETIPQELLFDIITSEFQRGNADNNWVNRSSQSLARCTHIPEEWVLLVLNANDDFSVNTQRGKYTWNGL